MSHAQAAKTSSSATLAPLDLVSAHPWSHAVFTTYALSLSFFESVVLDALVRGGGRESLILADVQGVRASLNELGAHRVGKDYDVEPVAVSGGVFHPKVAVFCSGEECHLLVGSGNLTFGGWGGNCEVLEHLHPSFAADAMEDAASFFESIALTERVRCSAGKQCTAIAVELRKCASGKPRNRNIRLFHSLGRSIAEQIAEVVAELGGAQRLVAAAPFWDGSAVDQLCAAIGLDRLFVHAHPHGCVEGFAGSNWPTGCRNKVQAIQLELLNAQGQRRLHGKLFEIICKRGRMIVSGSANGTGAALNRNHNVEACIVRIQPLQAKGWTFILSDPPESQAARDEDRDTEGQPVGVLRAVLDADELSGEVLVPRMSGPVSVSCTTGTGSETIGETVVSLSGAFRIAATALEERSWLAGRLVIRVTDQHQRIAEGFVSIASYADITRRAGAIGRRLFAVLAGTETPEDVAAIITWFYEDVRRLSDTLPTSGSSETGESTKSEDEAVISVADLALGEIVTVSPEPFHPKRAHGNWLRFMNHIFSAFRQRREPLTARSNTTATTEDEEEGDSSEAPGDSEKENAAIEKAFTAFDRLFDLLLSNESSVRNLMVAFDLTHYICGRMQPEVSRVKDWLSRLVSVLLKAGVPVERQRDVAAAVLLLAGTSTQGNASRVARDRLIRMKMDFQAGIPAMENVPGFVAALPSSLLHTETWQRILEIRTFPEQARAYLRALNSGGPSSEYAELVGAAVKEKPVLDDALTSPTGRERILELNHYQEFCPRCRTALPKSEVSKLQIFCVATAENCCRRVIVWPGD